MAHQRKNEIALTPRPINTPRQQSWWLNCPDRQTFSAAARANQPAIRSGRFGHMSESNYITARDTRAKQYRESMVDDA